ncbi:MAG: sulfite exporter TauE/SafE family protein [Calditrichia bacterium]
MDHFSLLLILVFLAYILKGLTGFGPALIIVPFFTLLTGVEFALPASAVFDTVAGLILLLSLYRQINWRFCTPLFIAIGMGSFLGANIVISVSPTLIRSILALVTLSFAIYLFFSGNNHPATGEEAGRLANRRVRSGAVLSAFAGGLTGGLAGISGPPIVIYLKQFFSKSFFRAQLTVVFLFENLVRLTVYYKGGLLKLNQGKLILFLLPGLLTGLWIGSKLHFQISEKWFNRLVAIILLLVSLKIIFR